MKIAIGSDHAGLVVKERVREYLAGAGYEVEDFGATNSAPSDYPDYAEKVCLAVREGRCDLGVLACGTGIGVCIAANKVRGIRAATAWSAEMARLSRQHNDANVICLPGRYTDPGTAVEFVRIWLSTSFEGGRHAVRVGKLKSLEDRF
jgi:ribose 5-phosphate isomerase B